MAKAQIHGTSIGDESDGEYDTASEDEQLDDSKIAKKDTKHALSYLPKSSNKSNKDLHICSPEEETDTGFPKLMKDLQLGKGKYGIVDASTLRKIILDNENVEDVMWKFTRAMTSMDCRGRKYLQLPTSISGPQPDTLQSDEEDLFDITNIGGQCPNESVRKISSMDVTLAILHCCDPFLRQELLWKMTECRLAVPILLPYLDDSKIVEIQLWGLRKVYKSWKPRSVNSPIEKCVVDYPMPIVSFLRFGEVSLSKSKLLNKILGKVQGNGDYSYFVDNEEEPPCAEWSKGSVEVAWFLPEDAVDENNTHALKDAVAFFNLRGDALEFEIQTKFLCGASDVVVLLVEEENHAKFKERIKDFSTEVAKHLICMFSSTNRHNENNTKRKDNVTIMFSKPFLEEMGATLCQELNRVLCSQGAENFNSIYSLKGLCKQLGIDIDEETKDCQVGKKFANDVLRSIRECSDDYKGTYLPLSTRGDMWKKWATLDKQLNKGYDHSFDSVEHYRDDVKNKMRVVREQQRLIEPSGDILKVVEALKSSRDSRRYFVACLDLYLNDLSRERLGPLSRKLRCIQDKSRIINAQSTKLQKEKDTSRNWRLEHTLLNNEETKLQERASVIVNSIDKGTLGVEHFIRELGQYYEAYIDLKDESGTNVDLKFNPEMLPDLVADLLIDGYPIEVLDGDVGQVPLTWVQAVFVSVAKKLGDAKVLSISVLGIQSSGKSTLLNCMFGAHFAVSAGRCTRGVFIQLLKVHEDIQKEIQCDYIIIIDTEGLKAPERSHRYDFRHDNELATFALCLADLTIINIAGQTVGKDMTDVLQIAAHAFIRMNEVHLKSSCRIIQQFVADLAAVEKNEASTQSILRTLDEAIAAAAREEGYGDIYSRFSDVFNLKRADDVQYIPSLWQGSMAPPNHRYSEKILKLQNVLVGDLKQSGRTLGQFFDRLKTVWEAVKEENFVFIFQNCVAALQYKTFQHSYGKWISEMRQTVMESEANAKQKMKNAPPEYLEKTKLQQQEEIIEVVNERGEEVKRQIARYLTENNGNDDEQLNRFKDEFLRDLELTKRNFIQDAKEAFNRIAASFAQLNYIGQLLPKCKNQLREEAREKAINLRETQISEDEIDQIFDNLWTDWMKEIRVLHPKWEATLPEVEKEFDTYLTIVGGTRDISPGLKNRLLKQTKAKLNKITRGIVDLRGSSVSPKEIADHIIDHALLSLKQEINNDLAYDAQIKQKYIDFAINKLNDKYDGKSLTQDIKIKAMLKLCHSAAPIIYESRLVYNNKYSLQERITTEKENLKKDFRAFCLDDFQDKRAAESLVMLLKDKIIETLKTYLGPAVCRAARETYPYFGSKFAMFGRILQDLAEEDDFEGYYNFLFELDTFLNDWTLQQIAKFCATAKGDGGSFLQNLAEAKVGDIKSQLIRSIDSIVVSPENSSREQSNNKELFQRWIRQFCDMVEENIPNLHLSEENMKCLDLFDVKDLTFFKNEIKDDICDHITGDIMACLQIPHVGDVEGVKKVLCSLPNEPHLDIKKHVTGCTKQCPICHVPCDKITKEHPKHRAELHYPEGLIGCATRSNRRLVCSICTSSVTTNETYWDGKCDRKYNEYQKDYPSWVIQPIQNESPLKYWQWVMNRFNEDFAKLYGHNEAKLPDGWISITRKEAIDDLKEAYVTEVRSDQL